jgi:hypothetical protein
MLLVDSSVVFVNSVVHDFCPRSFDEADINSHLRASGDVAQCAGNPVQLYGSFPDVTASDEVDDSTFPLPSIQALRPGGLKKVHCCL